MVRSLRPLPIRALWENMVLDLAPHVPPPAPFMSQEELSLMLLIDYGWKGRDIDRDLCDSADAVFDEANVCRVRTTQSQCLSCLKDYADESRSEAACRTQMHPSCGHFCDFHRMMDIRSQLNDGSTKLVCTVCNIRHLSSSINPEDLERFKQNVDREFAEKEPNMFNCPSGDCEAVLALQPQDRRSLVHVACGQCDFQFCSRVRSVWTR